jgi:hypothetical protein
MYIYEKIKFETVAQQIIKKEQNRHYCINIRFYSNVDIVVFILFLFYYLLCYCPKLYLFVNDTQQDAYHKA